ncbi:MAG: YceI family protein [Rhodocyclaceae bacterium]|nr:YceI family protein [Rhodocyclaceae bacterium]
MKRSPLLLLLLATLGTSSAFAVEYTTVIPEKSKITFTSKQMGVPVDGKFGKFTATLNFDPAKPEAAKAQIEIDLASVDAGSKEANDEVISKGWFNVKEFPKARFVSTSVKSVGGSRYEARGQMSIKGKTRDMTIAFSYRPAGVNAVFEGLLPLQRTQFGIGEGAWGDTSVVADEVPIKFRLTASQAIATPKK